LLALTLLAKEFTGDCKSLRRLLAIVLFIVELAGVYRSFDGVGGVR